MPLSEDDQRKLDQIEQALAKDDPRFAGTVKSIGGGAAGSRWPAPRSPSGWWFVLIVGLVITQAVVVLAVIISIGGR